MIAKAELHVHLEGAVFPSLVKRLALKNGVDLPENIFANDETFYWKDFLDFLHVYETASQVIRSGEDYKIVTYEYLARSAQEGAIYVEVMPSPDHAALAGMSYQEMLEGVISGMEDAKRDHQIESRIFISAVRHYGVEKCEAVAKLAAANPHPLVTGFGLGGDEINFPPKQFAKTFHIAHEAGLSCTCHAGEWCGPNDGLWDAVNYLPLKRIGHGVRAIEDEKLIAEIIQKDITLECAPGSNISLGVYPNYEQHPFLLLRDAGVKVTLNSDDPPYFATTLGKEYDNAQKHFQLTDEELKDITRNALNAAFVDDETRQELLKRV